MIVQSKLWHIPSHDSTMQGKHNSTSITRKKAMHKRDNSDETSIAPQEKVNTCLNVQNHHDPPCTYLFLRICCSGSTAALIFAARSKSRSNRWGAPACKIKHPSLEIWRFRYPLTFAVSYSELSWLHCFLDMEVSYQVCTGRRPAYHH